MGRTLPCTEGLVVTTRRTFTPSSTALCFLLKAPCHLLCFHPGNSDHGAENRDPIHLDGFISIQLHSTASRFLISHFTIKDDSQGRAGRGVGGAVLSAAHPGRTTASRLEDSGTAALDPSGQQKLKRPHLSHPAGCHSQAGQQWTEVPREPRMRHSQTARSNEGSKAQRGYWCGCGHTARPQQPVSSHWLRYVTGAARIASGM